MDILWCSACRPNEDKTVGMKNYSNVWLSGSKNHMSSNLLDHATSDQHKAAMNHVRKASGLPITSYSLIARSLLTLDKSALEHIVWYLLCSGKKLPGLYIVPCNLRIRRMPWCRPCILDYIIRTQQSHSPTT